MGQVVYIGAYYKAECICIFLTALVLLYKMTNILCSEPKTGFLSVESSSEGGKQTSLFKEQLSQGETV